MNKILSTTLVVLFFIPIFAIDPMEIIKNYGLNSGKISYEGIEVSILFDNPDFPKTSMAKVIANGKYMVRRDFLSPPFMLGRINIDDGKFQYDFDPKKNLVKISPSSTIFLNKDEINKRLNLIKKNFSTKLEREEVYLGRKVYVLTISSVYTKKVVLRLWIDKDKYIPLRIDKYNSDGVLIGRIMFVEIGFNPKLQNDLFDSNILKDKNVKMEETKLREEKLENASVPSELSLGYSLIKYYTIWERDDKFTHYFKYTDGLNDASLFKGLMPFKLPGKPTDIDNFHVFYDSNVLWKSISWVDGDNFYLLIGDFPKDYLSKIISTFIKDPVVK
ncbi:MULTISPECIES: sigma-E factor regulatory protein RseB domain-containing protein [Dictyoglomus]|uniref:MucB/RseB N-terminal domain-containing protein n=1 Tax=Dictyoglomus turgidum (strain DSM 6724 / Z-1310) TaxID=515635 RepID=B8E043_DICTD|nr:MULTISPECIES: sigma-E factor regulatory protein RseB domain-containing protein [Dictyoglomus]ACK42126.1 conserved hypothetical protein [Dictyoglomus turgidum DSM 6724]HBU32357.1 hypothetical protein [Dictyoglomus sp.]